MRGASALRMRCDESRRVSRVDGVLVSRVWSRVSVGMFYRCVSVVVSEWYSMRDCRCQRGPIPNSATVPHCQFALAFRSGGGVRKMLLRRGVAHALRVRSLGAWAAQFDTARGSPVQARLELGKKLESVWKLERDEREAAALEAESGAPAGSQLTFVLSVEDTAVAIMRAALLQGETGLLIGTQCDPALCLTTVGAPLIGAAREALELRGAQRILAVAPLTGLCGWVVENKLWQKIDRESATFHEDQPGAVEAVAKGVHSACTL